MYTFHVKDHGDSFSYLGDDAAFVIGNDFHIIFIDFPLHRIENFQPEIAQVFFLENHIAKDNFKIDVIERDLLFLDFSAVHLTG